MSPRPSGAPRLRLGTRASALAVAQSGWVARRLERLHPGLDVELVTLVTRGDRLPGDLSKLGGKGLFTEELEAGLLEGTLDLAVHSLKDLPVDPPAALALAAYPQREDPRDVLLSFAGERLEDLPAGAVVLTGSLRRRCQVLAARPDLKVQPIRGNVDTRITKWRRGDGDALLLAAAGLKRLGLQPGPELPIHPIPEVAPKALNLLPAPGQGTLAVQVAAGSPAQRLVAELDHPPTRAASEAERSLVSAFGGDCTLPLAAWARFQEGTGSESELILDGLLGTPDGEQIARAQGRGADAAEAAEACLDALKAAGADEILAQIRREGLA